MIDVFEDDEVDRPDALLIAAQTVAALTANTDHSGLGATLADFLRFAAREGFAVEFWL
jgi:hypothetical protein